MHLQAIEPLEPLEPLEHLEPLEPLKPLKPLDNGIINHQSSIINNQPSITPLPLEF